MINFEFRMGVIYLERWISLWLTSEPRLSLISVLIEFAISTINFSKNIHMLTDGNICKRSIAQTVFPSHNFLTKMN